MANPTEVGKDPVVIATSTAKASITLSVNKQYTIHHNGLNVSAVADTNPVYYTTDAAATTPTAAAGTSRGIILSTSGIVLLGPGVEKLTYISKADIPTLTITPISLQRGSY